MAAEIEKEKRLAIIKIPLKMAVSLIFDNKNRGKISVQILYRGNSIDIEKCEIVDFIYDWNSQTLDFRLSSPEFRKIHPDGGTIPFCGISVEKKVGPNCEIFLPAGFEIPQAGENYSDYKLRQQNLEKEIEPNLKTANSEIENSAAENFSDLNSRLNEIRRDYLEQRNNYLNAKWEEENLREKKIDARFREKFTEAEVDEAVERILKKAELWSDEPEFFKREN